MASNSTLPTLPNPYTPLAFLPPTLADQFQASGYLYVAGLSVCIVQKVFGGPQLNFSPNPGVSVGLVYVNAGRV